MPPISVDHFWYKSLARCLTAYSSSPQINIRLVGAFVGVRAINYREMKPQGESLQLPAILVDFLKPLGHVLDLAEETARNVNRTLLGARDGQAIAGPCVELNQLGAQFIALLEDQPRKVS